MIEGLIYAASSDCHKPEWGLQPHRMDYDLLDLYISMDGGIDDHNAIHCPKSECHIEAILAQ